MARQSKKKAAGSGASRKVAKKVVKKAVKKVVKKVAARHGKKAASRARGAGGSSRVRRSPDEARAVIIAAARKVFAEMGLDAAGLKDVAAEAGVSHGLITHYFGTFDGLVESTLAEHMQATRQRLLVHLTGGGPISAERFIEAFFEVMEDPVHGRLMTWAILSGRFQSKDFFPRKEQGPARVVDAVQLWFASRGIPGVDREELELIFILIVTAGIGYGMGKSVLWGALGHDEDAGRDHRFRALMAEIIEDRLRAHGAMPQS